jgi:hypothetical protein
MAKTVQLSTTERLQARVKRKVASGTQKFDPVDTLELKQGLGVLTESDTNGAVVAAGQFSASSTAKGGVVIAIASEAVAEVGSDVPLVGNESGVVRKAGKNATFGYNAVAKVRMDSAPVGPYRPLKAGAALFVSAQPDTAWSAAIQIDDGAVDGSVMNLPGTMLVRKNGKMFIRIAFDGANNYLIPVVGSDT